MVYPINFTKRIYCLITGASRGIGRQIAIELAHRSVSKLTLVLLARSDSGLQETSSLIHNINKNVNIITKSLDLYKTDADDFKKILQETFVKSEFDTTIIIHNAGHIGTIQRASELSNRDTWQKYCDLNIVSVTVLNSVFLKTVQNNADHIFVINITSLLGRKAFKYFSMYSSGKAARDLYFKILAEEESEIVVLNYSPGMVKTSMSDDLISNIQLFEDSELAQSTKNNPTILTPEQSINKLISLLEKGEFKSGDIIDYYD